MKVQDIVLDDRLLDRLINATIKEILLSQEGQYYVENFRAGLWKQYVKKLIPYEITLEKKLKELFSSQEKEVLRNLTENAPKKSFQKQKGEEEEREKMVEEEYMFDKKKWEKRFEKEIKTFFLAVIIAYGTLTFDEIETSLERLVREKPEIEDELESFREIPSFTGNTDRIKKFIQENGIRFGRETQDTAYENLKVSLVKGIEQGESIPKLSKRIKEQYEDYIGKNNWKAKRIAQTEVGKASNFAAQESYKQSGVVIGKEWLSSRDKRVRDAHQEQKIGQIRVELDKPFIVDGEELMFPGDERGLAKNVINCRCTILPILEGEKNII